MAQRSKSKRPSEILSLTWHSPMSRSKIPESISTILSSTLKHLQLEKPIQKYSVMNNWEDIVGEKIAEKTKPSHFSGDTLVVGVDSHAWMTELNFMKPAILEKIRQKSQGHPIKNLRFELSKIQSLADKSFAKKKINS